jgi:uncharacterized membrane protein
MTFLAIMLLFFVFSRMMCSHSGRRRYAHNHVGWHRAQHFQRPAPEPPTESAFERLKRKFVSGEISAETYEAELDALLRTPEGRTQVF